MEEKKERRKTKSRDKKKDPEPKENKNEARKKKWLYNYSIQKMIPYEHLFPGVTKDDKVHHYTVNLEIQNIAKQIMDEKKAKKVDKREKFSVQLNLSFYHSKHSSFFGRTYQSSLIKGSIAQGFFKARRVGVDVYFNSQYTTDEVFLIVDTMVVREGKDDEYFSVGYYIIDLFRDRSKSVKTFYNAGTPRDLLIKNNFDNVMTTSTEDKEIIVKIDKIKINGIKKFITKLPRAFLVIASVERTMSFPAFIMF